MQTKKLGLLVPKVNEMYISFANTLGQSFETELFYREKTAIKTDIAVAVLPVKEAWYFDADFVVFDLWGAKTALDFPRCKKLFFCSNQRHWMETRLSYEFYHSIYMDERTLIICGNKNDADIVGKCWKPVFGNVENYNGEGIIDLILNYEKHH